MSLATRCTQCGTAFRVVQDQLKISEGWVRCGRCSEVFNALEGLFDLDREGPISGSMSLRPVPAPDDATHDLGAIPPAPPPSQRDERGAYHAYHAEPVAPAAPVAPDVGYGFAGTDFDNAETQFQPREDFEQNLPMAFAQDSRSDEDFDGPLSDTQRFYDTAEPATAARDSAPRSSAPGALEADAHDAFGPVAPDATPGFLREAERAAAWRHPRARATLAAGAALLALALVGQWAVHRRDALAATWPEASGPLAALCDLLGCRIEPLRRIEALAVESSGLTRLDGSTLYRLEVNLRNHELLPVMTPALDLSLTDTRSDVMARRVLSAADWASAQPGLPVRLAPGAELQLSAILDLGERRVAGYTVELFYP